MPVSAAAARPVNRKPPALPRPPQSFAFDGPTGELTITDCNGVREVYRLLPLRSDFGPFACELVIVGSARFGECHQVLLDDSGHWNCSCPGHCYRGVCKHVRALAALREGGAL